MSISTHNRHWCATLASHLRRPVVVSPGSRSTPLVLAYAAMGDVPVHCILDERAAAFLRAWPGARTGQAVVLVCTSGSAGAHYLPAVIEAHASGIPLIVLTADRPSEPASLRRPADYRSNQPVRPARPLVRRHWHPARRRGAALVAVDCRAGTGPCRGRAAGARAHQRAHARAAVAPRRHGCPHHGSTPAHHARLRHGSTRTRFKTWPHVCRPSRRASLSSVERRILRPHCANRSERWLKHSVGQSSRSARRKSAQQTRPRCANTWSQATMRSCVTTRSPSVSSAARAALWPGLDVESHRPMVGEP